MPASPFIWPDSIRETSSETTLFTLGDSEEGIKIPRVTEEHSSSRAVAKLSISGITFYVCALGSFRDKADDNERPGCIIYEGTPDDAFRKKVRTALSFALGVYLVELGHTNYDHQWQTVSTFARSAYSLRGHAFDMGPQQLAPLGSNYHFELDSKHLSRAVSALVSSYDALDLANLNWAYWHACAATPHIAPAHFGAVIENLQNAYISANPGKISQRWLPSEIWKPLKTTLKESILEIDASVEVKTTLIDQVGILNKIGQRPLLKAVFAALGLELSQEEDAAWQRRNRAAHGTPIPENEMLSAIHDMNLLRGVFQRMLLRITDAADQYIDYASPERLNRPLSTPPSSRPQRACRV